MGNIDNDSNDSNNYISNHEIRTTNISDTRIPLNSHDFFKTPNRSMTRGCESKFERSKIDCSKRQSSLGNDHLDRVVEKSKQESLEIKHPIVSLTENKMDATQILVNISPSSVLYHPNNKENIIKKKLKVKSSHRAHLISKHTVSKKSHGCFHSITKINKEMKNPPKVLRKSNVRFYAQDRPKDPVAKTLWSSCIHTFFKPLDSF